jgi:hypothetical protein
MRRIWITIALLLLWGNIASAAVIISNAGKGEETPGSGIWDWFYSVTLQPDQVFRPGDYFTIYDVPNILSGPGSVMFGSVSGSFITQIAGTTPPDPFGALTKDDPAINNIKITLDPSNSANHPIEPIGTGAVILGTLVIKSSTGSPLQTNYAAQAELNKRDSTSVGLVDVATLVEPRGTVPEPSSLTIMLLGLFAFGAVALRRRRG